MPSHWNIDILWYTVHHELRICSRWQEQIIQVFYTQKDVYSCQIKNSHKNISSAWFPRAMKTYLENPSPSTTQQPATACWKHNFHLGGKGGEKALATDCSYLKLNNNSKTELTVNVYQDRVRSWLHSPPSPRVSFAPQNNFSQMGIGKRTANRKEV